MSTDAEIASDASISLGMLVIASKHQKLEEARRDSPLESSERIWPCRHLSFRLLFSRTRRQKFLLFEPSQFAILY